MRSPGTEWSRASGPSARMQAVGSGLPPRATGEARFRNPYYTGSSGEGSASSPMTPSTTAGFGEARDMPGNVQGSSVMSNRRDAYRGVLVSRDMNEQKTSAFLDSVGVGEDGFRVNQLCETMQSEMQTLDSTDDLFSIDCTRHSFDVARIVDGQRPPTMKSIGQGSHFPTTQGRSSLGRGHIPPLPGDRNDYPVTMMKGDLQQPSKVQVSPNWRPGTAPCGLAPNHAHPLPAQSIPPVPPLRLNNESFLTSSGGSIAARSKQGFRPEYEMFDRRRPHHSKDSHGSLNMIGSLAKVWSVNPNHNGTRAYRVTEVPISETGSMLSRWESCGFSDYGSEILESALLDSTLDTADYNGSDYNMYSSIQSIPENPLEEDEFMVRVREALRNAEMERMETSSTDISRVSWIQHTNMARTLRDAHCAPLPPQSVLIRTRTASPGGCFLPIPCVHSKYQKDSSLLPNLVVKLSKSISARARKARSPQAQSPKKKTFSGLRKVFSKASKLFSGKKSNEAPEATGWSEQGIVEPNPRMICLPASAEGSNFLIQSTMESWCGNPLPEPEFEDLPQTCRSDGSAWNCLQDIVGSTGHPSRGFKSITDDSARANRGSSSYQNTYSTEYERQDLDENTSGDGNLLYIDPYGLFDQTRRNIGQSAVPSEVEAMEGLWVLDRSRSDKVDKMCNILELDSAMRAFWKSATCLEIQLLDGKFKTSMRVPNIYERVEEVPLNGKEVFPQRCDHVQGKMCLSASLPTRGFLTFASWQSPRAGNREEHYWMEDEQRRLCISTRFEYENSGGCKLMWVFRRSESRKGVREN